MEGDAMPEIQPPPRLMCIDCLSIYCERCDRKHGYLGCLWTEPGALTLREGPPGQCAEAARARTSHEYICRYHGSRQRWTPDALLRRAIRQDTMARPERSVSI